MIEAEKAVSETWERQSHLGSPPCLKELILGVVP
jgi:hypothetical protein